MDDHVNPLLTGDTQAVAPAATTDENPLILSSREEAPPAKKALEWSDVPGEAVKNIWPSTKAFAAGMVQPILHPVETLGAVKDIGSGLLSKAGGALGVQQDPADKAKTEATVNALGHYYGQRYGTMEGFKEALATDPVGLLADASMILSGGGSLAARAPGAIGRAGEAAVAAGRAANPINIALKAAAPVVSAGAKAAAYPLAVTTGAPAATLAEAVGAGRVGSRPFLEQMRGTSEPSAIVDAAQSAMSKLAARRRDDYLASKAGWSASQSQLDYTPINQAIASAYGDVMHGQNVYKPQAKAMLDAISHEVMNWQTTPNSPGVNYHNVEGFDKLKQLIGDIRSSAPPGSPAEAMGTRVYNAIRKAIADQDSTYMKAMGEYSDASDMLKQLKSTLSINPRASVDTTLRKLLLAQKQVDGQKGTLLKELSAIDPEISRMIAGHILHSPLPIGFRGGIGAALTGGAGLLGGTAGLANPVGTAAHAVASSPRAVGETLYHAGKVAKPGASVSAAALAPTLLDKRGEAKKPPETDNKRPYFPGPGEARPLTIRPARKSGGRVSHERLVDRLMKACASAKKDEDGSTKGLLDAPDEHIVHALGVAQRAL